MPRIFSGFMNMKQNTIITAINYSVWFETDLLVQLTTTLVSE